jgi:hypothetical protein
LAKSKANKAWPLIRQWHIYVSVFVAPSLIFFAITGALQTFRIPDRTDAPVLVQKLARVHRDDVFALKAAKPKAAESSKPVLAEKPKPTPKAKPSTEVAKWFFAVTSVAIAVTTLFGLWMALAYNRRKAVIWALLIAGAAAPVIILVL